MSLIRTSLNTTTIRFWESSGRTHILADFPSVFAANAAYSFREKGIYYQSYGSTGIITHHIGVLLIRSEAADTFEATDVPQGCEVGAPARRPTMPSIAEQCAGGWLARHFPTDGVSLG